MSLSCINNKAVIDNRFDVMKESEKRKIYSL